ncbi:MAG: sporulation protein YtfJ [Clostridia bacterium]|nr:sporulation protein YtfJ [Clostridia bacterium]
MAENKISEILGESIESLKQYADAETVIGQPITTPDGTTVIPVSKISMGFASGGLDYAGKKTAQTTTSHFGGGGGTGVTISPVAFLIISPTGGFDLLPITSGGDGSTVDKVAALIERSPDILQRLKDVLIKDKKKEETAEETGDTAAK